MSKRRPSRQAPLPGVQPRESDPRAVDELADRLIGFVETELRSADPADVRRALLVAADAIGR
jgi:hypothetical protein